MRDGPWASCFFTMGACTLVTNMRSARWRRRLARALQRIPGSGPLLQRMMRLVQPRFSMGVAGVLLDETRSRVLLVEHIFHPKNPWGLPGGWIDRGEDPAQTIVREMWEEVGLRVRTERPLLVQRAPTVSGLMDVAYLCALDGAGQNVVLNNELLDFRWAALDELDDLPRMVDFHYAAIAAACQSDVAPEQLSDGRG